MVCIISHELLVKLQIKMMTFIEGKQQCAIKFNAECNMCAGNIVITLVDACQCFNFASLATQNTVCQIYNITNAADVPILYQL